MSCLLSFARAPPTCKEGKQAKSSKWKYVSPPGFEQPTFWFLAGRLDRLAIETVDYLCFKQYSEMTDNEWGVSKHVAIHYIKLMMVIYLLQQNYGQNLSQNNVDVIYYCLHLNFNTLISCIATWLETPHAYGRFSNNVQIRATEFYLLEKALNSNWKWFHQTQHNIMNKRDFTEGIEVLRVTLSRMLNDILTLD